MGKLAEAVLGPVFLKEMLQTGRSRQTFIARLALSLFLAGIFAVSGTSTTITQANLARIASDIFWSILVAMYFAVYFLVPAMLAGVIAGERERGTLDLVLMSAVGIRELAVGKLLSRLAAVALILLVTVPFLALVGLFGGVDYDALLWGIASTLQTTLFLASISFYASATSRGTLAALIRAYVWIVVMMLIAPFLVMVCGSFLFPGSFAVGETLAAYLQLLYPPTRFRFATDASFANALASQVHTAVFPFICGFDLVVSSWIFWRAIGRARREGSRRKRQRFVWSRKWSPRSETAPSDSRWKLSSLRRSNPVWYRGYISNCYDPERYLKWLWAWSWPLLLLFAVIVALTESSDWIDMRALFSGLFQFLFWFTAGLLGLVVGATSIVGDRRRGFWDQVLVTPLSARECIDGVLLAALEHVGRFWLLPMVLAAEALFLGIFETPRLAGAIVTGILCTIVLCQVGVVLSSAAQSLGQALLSSIGFLLIVGFGVPFLAESLRPESAALIRVYAPIPLVLCATAIALRRRPGAWQSMFFLVAVYLASVLVVTDISLWNPATIAIGTEHPPLASTHPISMTVTSSLAATLGYWLSLLLFLATVRYWSVRRFDELNGRVPQLTDSNVRASGG